jgi:glycosyltransferase involved in cell wall biosynthesis
MTADCVDDRPLTSLHVSNVANVAYGVAKLLNAHGSPASVVCHDVTHLMSQPEWDDVALDPHAFPDQNNFYDNTADFGGYARPAWFASESVDDPFAAVGSIHRRARAWLGRHVPAAVRRTLEPLYFGLRHWQVSLARWRDAPSDPEAAASRARIGELVARSAALGAGWKMDARSLSRYLPHRAWLARHAAPHDVVCTYALSPIYGMLYGDKPQISLEIGTMRELPFGGQVPANLLWPAYRFSDHVLITNPDNRALADAAGLPSYSFCPHPVDDRVFSPGDEPGLRQALLDRCRVRHLLFAPARQNWRIKGNDKLLHAFASLRRAGVDAALLLPAWGQEVARSQALARDLGVASHTVWLPPMSEPLLARHYRAVDLVCDQFNLGVFGLITPKAMACGTPVLTSYLRRHHAWCFDEDPPVAPCSTAEEIVAAARSLLQDEERRRAVGAASRAWIDRHHSPRRVVDAFREAMAIARDGFRRRANGQTTL